MPLLLLAIACIASAALLDPIAAAPSFTHPLLAHGDPRPSVIEGLVLARWALIGVAAAAGVAFTLTRGLGAAAVIPPSQSEPLRRGEWLLFVAVMLAGVAFRLQRADESLWYDEIAALKDYTAFGPGAIVASYFSPSNHIAQSLASWCIMWVAGGANEFTIRAPSLIAGAALVAAMGWLVASVAGRRLGLVAAGMTALMPICILESVEARGYAMAMLFSALGIACGVRAATSRWPGWRVLAGSSALALAAWSHLVAGVLTLSIGLIGMGLLFAPQLRREGRALTALAALGGAITLLLLSPALPDIVALRHEFSASDGDEPGLFGIEGWHMLLQQGGAWVPWAALPGVIVALIGLYRIWRLRSVHPHLAIAVAIPVFALCLLGAAVSLGDSWVYARFALFAVPASITAIALGLDALRQFRPRDALVPTLAALAIAVGWTASLLTLPPKQPIRDAVSIIAQSGQPGDVVATIGLRDHVVAYYANAMGVEVRDTGDRGTAAAAILEEPRVRWAIMLYPEIMPAETMRAIDAAGFVGDRVLPGWADWGRGTIIVFHRPAASAPLRFPHGPRRTGS